MTVEQSISNLVTRVRAAASGGDPANLRDAFHRELAQIAHDHRADPKCWSAWADGRDVIGEAYEELLTGAYRRAAGQFQTPFWAADVMVGWLLKEPTPLICDPAVGTGRLLFRASARPGRSPDRMLGLDVDRVALAMADLNFQLRGVEHSELRHRDFLRDELPERPTAIACNPPYCRHHLLPAAIKEEIHTSFERRLGLRLSRLAGLQTLFLVRALEVAADGGRLAFITPADWLNVNYGEEVKRFVLEQAHVDALVVFPDDHLFFADARTTAAITLLRKGEGSSDAATKIVRLPPQLPDPDQVLAALDGRQSVIDVETVKLGPTQKWSRPIPKRRQGKPLAELARVRRGIATGCNAFFVISEPERRARRLRNAKLRPCIISPRLISGLEFTNDDLDLLPAETPRWLIYSDDPHDERADTAIGRYLRWGVAQHNADQTYLAQHRKPWYAVDRRESAPILFTYLNKDRPRFIRNRAGAAPLNTFLAIEPFAGIDADKLWQALNQSTVIEQLIEARRNYGNGLWKLEPRELMQVRVRL